MSIASGKHFRTPAEYIAAHQEQHPPIYLRADRGEALFQGALRFSSPIIQAKAARGLIAGGEIGELTPVAYVAEIAHGHAIVIHSGLMRLLYNAAKALTATDRGLLRDEARTPALSPRDAADNTQRSSKTTSNTGAYRHRRFPRPKIKRAGQMPSPSMLRPSC